MRNAAKSPKKGQSEKAAGEEKKIKKDFGGLGGGVGSRRVCPPPVPGRPWCSARPGPSRYVIAII